MIFDFNIHLNRLDALSKNVHGKVADESSLDVPLLLECYQAQRSEFVTTIAGANFMLFNPKLPFGDHQIGNFVSEVRKDFPSATFTQLLDFRREGITTAVDRLVSAKVQGVKFHSYVQAIADTDIKLALSAAHVAAERGLFICVDTSYGSTYMYEHVNMKLAAEIAREIKNVPIILLHSGGAKRWEALLLADEVENVFLETSFSLPYYEGATIFDDFAFIYKKIGVERVLYASDHPAVSLTNAKSCMDRFIERYGFTQEESELMFHGNAERLIGELKVS